MLILKKKKDLRDKSFISQSILWFNKLSLELKKMMLNSTKIQYLFFKVC